MSEQFDPQLYTIDNASDPAATPEVLEAIAYYRPDLRAAVAANPACTAQVRDHLAGWGITLPQAAPSASWAPPSPAAGSSWAPPAPNAGSEAWSASTSGGQQPDAAPASSWSTPGPGGWSAPDASAHGATPYGVPGVSAGVPGGPVPPGGQPPAVPRKSGRAKWIGLGVAGVLVVGAGGAYAANALWFSKVGGAASAQESVENLLDALGGSNGDKDLVALYGAVAPSEIDYATKVNDILVKRITELAGLNLDDYKVDIDGYADTVTVTTEDLVFEPVDLTDESGATIGGLQRVAFTGGKVTVDVDADKFVELSEKAQQKADELLQDIDPSLAEQESTQTDPDELRSQIEQTFPASVEFTSGGLAVTDASGNVETLEQPAGLISVEEEDGDWFVSPLLSIVDLGLASEGIQERGAIDQTVAAPGADSPEAAVEATVRSAADLLNSGGDLASLYNTLALPERRALAFVPSSVLTLEGWNGLSAEGASVTVDSFAATTQRTEDGTAWVEIDTLRATVDQAGTTVSTGVENDCLLLTDLSDLAGVAIDDVCFADVPVLKELGLGDLAAIAVDESGTWYTSVVLSGYDVAGVLGGNLLRLAQNGQLTEEWLTDPANWGPLSGLLTGLGSMGTDPFDTDDYSSGYSSDDYSSDDYSTDDWGSVGDAQTYGDDPELDALWLQCEQGSMEACDELYWSAPIGSDYESFAASCGNRSPGTEAMCATEP